jgi:hypothetical protein
MRGIVCEKINFVEGEVATLRDNREKIPVRLREQKKCLQANISPVTFYMFFTSGDCDPERPKQAVMRIALLIDTGHGGNDGSQDYDCG